MKIEVLSFDGCPTASDALELVTRICLELGIDTTVTSIFIDEEESVYRHRFLGSPSIRVEGEDVEEARRNDPRFALTCRVYQSGDLLSGLPSPEIVRAALIQAKSRETTT